MGTRIRTLVAIGGSIDWVVALISLLIQSSQAMETMVHYILNTAVDDIYFDSISCFCVNNDRHFLFLVGDYLLQRKLRGKRGS